MGQQWWQIRWNPHGIIKNQTWELVGIPKQKKVIGCKWVYQKKGNQSSLREGIRSK